jgi:NAD(P)-dependent dehydrogenase (short-subunit alcohol dehydrogenase family)
MSACHAGSKGDSPPGVPSRRLEGQTHVDILINSAGIFPFGPTREMTEELFDSVYSLNVKAPYFLVAELAPLMAKRGKGAIVRCSEPWTYSDGRHGGNGRGCGTTGRSGPSTPSRYSG